MPNLLALPRRVPALLALIVLAALAVTATAVQAKPRRAPKIVGESTTFTLSPAVTQRMGALGITLGVVAPATQSGPASVTLPITRVRGPVHRLRGVVRHAGALTLTRGERTVSLRNVTIVANGRRGHASARAGRRHVHVFRLTAPKRSVDGDKVTLTVELRLTGQAARWLNRRLPGAELRPGLLLGSATLTGTLASSRYADPFG